MTTRGGFENCDPSCPKLNYTYDFCEFHDPEGHAAHELEQDIQRARWVRWSWGSVRLPRFLALPRAKRQRASRAAHVAEQMKRLA